MNFEEMQICIKLLMHTSDWGRGRVGAEVRFGVDELPTPVICSEWCPLYCRTTCCIDLNDFCSFLNKVIYMTNGQAHQIIHVI